MDKNIQQRQKESPKTNAYGQKLPSDEGLCNSIRDLRHSNFQNLSKEPANADHAHLALIYETREELFAGALLFLQAGLEQGERCIYVTAETPQTELLKAMDAADYDFAAAREAGDLSFLSEEAYLTDGEFDPERMIDFLKGLTTEVTEEKGYKGLRIAGEATWALADDRRINNLVKYEKVINNFFKNYACTALCIYNREQFPPKVLEEVIRTHPQIVYNGTIVQNFYYVPQGERPDGENSLQTVERQMQSLVKYTHELRQSEKHYRALVAASSDVIYRLSPDWSEIRELQGQRFPADKYGPELNWIDKYILPDDRQQVKQAIDDAIQNKSVFELEHRILRENGTIGWLFTRAIPLVNEKEEIVEWFGTVSDVTRRKQTEQALRESKERLQTASEVANLGIFEWDPQNDQAKWENDRMFEIMAQSRKDDPVNAAVFLKEMVHPDDAEVFKAAFDKALKSDSFHFSGRFYRRDGALRWINLTGIMEQSDDGESVRMSGVAADITERKQREDREQFLLKLNDKLRTLSDAVETRQTATRIVGQQIQADRALYAEIGSDGESIYIADSYARRDLPKIGDTLNVNDFGSAVVASLRSGKTIAVEDVTGLPEITEAETHAYAALNIVSFVAVPLVKGERWVSNLIIYHSSFRQWTAEEVQLLEEAAELTWAAVERARAEEALRESEKRQAFLLELSDRIREETSREEIGAVSTRLLAEEMGLDRCYFVKFYPEEDRAMVGPEYYSAELEPVSGSYSYSAFPEAIKRIEMETPVYDNVANDTELPEAEKKGLLELDFGAWIGVPIRTGEKKVQRALYAVSIKPHHWTSDEIGLVEETAKRTWEAIERAEAEQALQTNEERLRLSLDVGGMGLWEFDFRDKSLTLSEMCKQNLHLAPGADLSFKQFQQMVHPEDRKQWTQKLKTVSQSGEMLSAEFRFYHPEGKLNWIYARGRMLSSGERTPGKITGISQNITARKQREKLEQEKSRLLKCIADGRPLHEILSALCETVPQLSQGVRASIVLVDDEGSAFQASIAPDLLPSWSKKTDGTPVNDLMIGTCGEAVFRGEAIGCKNIKEDGRWSHEWRKLCMENGIMAAHSEPIFDNEGNPGGSFMLCFSRPREPNEWELQLVEFGARISGVALEHNRAKKMLREYNQRLEEQVERRTKKMISYQGKLRELVKRLSQAEEQERRRLAGELHDNLGQMLAVIKMKLDFINLKNKNSHIGEASSLLDEAIAYTRELMSSLKPPDSLGDKNFISAVKWVIQKMEKYELAVDLEDDGKPKPLDGETRSAVLRALRELLFNVLKHSGVKKARVKLSRANGEVQVVVEDEGKGFDPDREKSSDEINKGFGLFDIQEQLDLLEGSLKIISAPDNGTRATIAIPVAESEKTETESAPRGGRQLETAFIEENESITVMLVDDHDITREGLNKIVEKEEDLKIVGEASNGVEAVEKALELTPDVIVMDINMPEMNGIEATKKIKAEWPDIQIIGLSFHTEGDTSDEMRKAGASAFVTKSEAVERLCDTIRGMNS